MRRALDALAAYQYDIAAQMRSALQRIFKGAPVEFRFQPRSRGESVWIVGYSGPNGECRELVVVKSKWVGNNATFTCNLFGDITWEGEGFNALLGKIEVERGMVLREAGLKIEEPGPES